jgi:hypothetical protein
LDLLPVLSRRCRHSDTEIFGVAVGAIQRVSRPLSFAWLGLLVDLFVLCSVRGDGHAPPRILDLNQNSVAGLAQWM